MKKLRVICWIMAAFWTFSCTSFAVSAVSEDAITNGCLTLDAGTSLAGNEQILPTAAAAILYAPQYDTMVYSWQPDVRMDPSGMNKLMTCLIALEQGNPDALVSVTYNALSSVETGALTAGLKVGEVLSLRDLLYCMMVGSANDAAAVIAEHIAGSQAAFVAQMNTRAAALGCTNTYFVNATGLSHEGQYTSARDLAKITVEAMQQELFTELFSAKEYTVPATDKSAERSMHTTNYMMSDLKIRDHLDTRITGGKTGALSTSDRSLISTAEKGGLQYLCIVMSAQSKLTADGMSVVQFGNFEETKMLLNHGYTNYSERQLLMGGDTVMAQFLVTGGENDLAVAPGKSVTALMPTDMSVTEISYRAVEASGGISAPVEAGDVVGAVELWYGSMCVAKSDLIAMHPVKQAGTSAQVMQPQANPSVIAAKKVLATIGIVVVVLVMLLLLVMVAIRAFHIYRHSKKGGKSTAKPHKRRQ